MGIVYEAKGSVNVDKGREQAIRDKAMSPPGGLPGISPRMEEVRLKYAIPDDAFTSAQCVYDRCLLWQIPRQKKEAATWGDTSILMPENAQKAEEESSPRAIIIGIGLAAADAFRDNGCELGDVVWFMRLSPYRIPVAVVDGRYYHAIICRAGDIFANETLAERMRNKEVVWELQDGQHRLVKKDGTQLTPTMPTIPADM